MSMEGGVSQLGKHWTRIRYVSVELSPQLHSAVDG
jgi:hypothetical protein